MPPTKSMPLGTPCGTLLALAGVRGVVLLGMYDVRMRTPTHP